MANLRDRLASARPVLLAVAAGLVVGTVFGWRFLGWVLFPVTYVNADPTALREDYKEAYIAMVADSFSIDLDITLAHQRLAGFSNQELSNSFAKIRTDLQGKGRDAPAARIQRLADSLGIKVASSAGGTPSQSPPVGATPAAAPAPGGTLPLGLILGALGLLLIVVGVGGFIWFMVARRRSNGNSDSEPIPLRPRDRAPARQAQPPQARARAPAVYLPPAPADAPPAAGATELGHFVTTYKIGDDGYDTSFSVESPDGEFLGECGVGISEVVGDGPQRVTAFEVWLFDKNDIKTVTKVLMSDYAYNNEAIRHKLQARGDAVLASPGGEVVLETESLWVSATIAEMAYGSSSTPQSFFARLTMELAPTVKNKAPA
ncbi:MAG: hypothetical protein HYR71_11870 [Chloroflexi bacterium]|nr:hypothetical protein [Chloroflexota bacterium]